MQGIVVGIVIHYVCSEIASQGASMDWAKVKLEAHAKIEAEVKYKAVTDMLEKACDSVVDGLAKVCQEKDGLSATLTALANHDMSATKAAVLTLLKPVVTGDLAALLSAA